MAITIPPTAKVTVTGNRCAIPEATVWCWNKEEPRFPWSNWLSQRRYCRQNGSLRCS